MKRRIGFAKIFFPAAAMGMALFVLGQTPREILTKKNPVPISNDVLTKARHNFEDNCTPCHGPEGKGNGPMADTLKKRPKDLTTSKEIGDLTDGEIFWLISKGRDPMPAFDQKLTDNERWGLVHLVRSLSNTKPNTTPHTK